MKNIVHSYVRKFREERRKSRRAIALLLALALVVSTGVTWQLHSTGIAMTNETYCGLEEHTHTEDCYEEVLVCGQEESEGHTHTEDCYETKTTLVCGKEESEGHTHTDDCYDEDGDLICGKEESKGHTHTDDCYKTEKVLVCGKEESEGHTHTEDCYETQLTCGKEEHTHTVDCLTDDTADVETASDWEATLPELTGVWADDVAAIAKSQLGYTESTANFTLDEDGTTRKGYTRYGAWYGNEYGDWDAMFASFCLYYAGVDEDDFPQASGAYAWVTALDKLGLYDEDAEPVNGDLAFFDTDKNGKADHVGIVAGVSDSKVTVIEGDSDDKVQSNAYSLSDSTITGYGVLPEQDLVSAASLEEEDVTVTAQASVDILEYIKNYSANHYNNPATATITVIDADGNTVKDGQLIVGEQYSIALDFYFEAGMETGTYVYTFPEGVTLGEGHGYVTIMDSSGTEITLGTWSIDSATGKLTFDLNNSYDLSRLSHIELSATVSAVFENNVQEVTIGDVTYTVIEPPEDTSASLHKRAVQINVDDNTISWVIEVDGGANVGLADQSITDTISTDNHELLESDIDSLTIEIQDDDGEYHTLSIDDADYWDWSESGWELVLPEEFECVSCGKTIKLPREDSTGWVVYIEYTTSITSYGSYETYGNTVTFYDLEKTGKITKGEGSIDKTGVYNAGDSFEDTTIDWTIEAFIPGGKVYNWHIYDSEDVVIGSSSQQYYYNALGESGTTITATNNGETYSVPNLADAANDGSDLIAWKLSDTSTEDGYDYGRTICFYTWDSEDGKWSQWWNIGNDTYLTITYSSSVVNDDENLIEEYNTQGASLRNSVQLQNQGTDGTTDNLVAEATAEVDLPSVLDKELTTVPTSGNDWVATYTVTFNEAMVDLSDLGTVEIVDTMSSTLTFMRDSISITAKDADGNTHKVTDYTIEYSNNVATIVLNESALGPYQYTLVYNAKINATGTVTYNNDITVTVSGEKFTDSVGSTQVDNVSAAAQTYSVTLTKQDATTKSPLAGAVFNVYNAEADALLNTVTTGTDGTATVQTNTAQGVVFKAHTLYYLIETKAPDGYILDNTTRYYFWFCNVDGTCSECAEMEDELEAAGVDSAYMYHGTYNSSLDVETISITVTNEKEQTYELPSTGGSGTWLYSLMGLTLCGGAALVLLRRRESE